MILGLLRRLFRGGHHPFDPDWRVHPSETLKEVMEDRGITTAELAEHLGPVTAPLLAGHAPISLTVAFELERLTAVPAQMWVALQAEYDRPLTPRRRGVRRRRDDGRTPTRGARHG